MLFLATLVTALFVLIDILIITYALAAIRREWDAKILKNKVHIPLVLIAILLPWLMGESTLPWIWHHRLYVSVSVIADASTVTLGSLARPWLGAADDSSLHRPLRRFCLRFSATILTGGTRACMSWRKMVRLLSRMRRVRLESMINDWPRQAHAEVLTPPMASYPRPGTRLHSQICIAML